MNMTVATPEAQKGFYPTPPELAQKLVEGIKFRNGMSVLEPSAGTGNLIFALAPAAYLPRYDCYYGKYEVDCCEIDPALRGILKENFSKAALETAKSAEKEMEKIGKASCDDPVMEYLRHTRALLENAAVRIVCDDFLRYDTQKAYDLIVMNPPFADGDAHLLKAISMQERFGGQIRCILNAETFRNPYTNRRKLLVRKLEDLHAEITYEKGAFKDADRSTDVDVAIIKIDVPAPQAESEFWSRCEKAVIQEEPLEEMPTDLVLPDIIKQFVARYKVEINAGCKLIREYIAMKPYILEKAGESEYNRPVIGLSVNGDHADRSRNPSVNEYIRAIRLKYWRLLFEQKEFVGQLTSNLRSLLQSRVKDMVHYEFSEFNIRTIMLEMNAAMTQAVQDTILNLFEELTTKYHYNSEFGKNIHYFNGWKTNKAHKIGKKVILPGYVFPSYSWSKDTFDTYAAYGKLIDIEKALNYLDGHMTEEVRLDWQLNAANQAGKTRNIHCKYFDVTFFKKGTIHITFTCPELIDRFNIYCARHRNWLPPRYGRTAYGAMDAEEKAVIDSFHGDGTDGSGEKGYADVVARSGYYLAPPNQQSLALPDAA